MQRHDLVRGFWKAAAALCLLAMWAAPTAAADNLAPREDKVYGIALKAYVYGYPLVEMYRVRDQSVFNPDNPRRQPLNRFRHLRDLLDATSRVVVAPNNDTLYSSAWLDLSLGPIVLDVPDTAGRYYVMQFMDFHTNNFAYVGKRTTGTGAGSYAVVGPGWQGALPAGVKELRSPTNAVWLLGRTLVDGAADLPAVRAVQDGYLLTPLAVWRKPGAGTDTVTPLPDLPRYTTADPLAFFQLLNAALTENPPPLREQSLMAQFAQIGVGAGKEWKSEALDAATAQDLKRAVETGRQLIAAMPSKQPIVNGWQGVAAHSGSFGDNYAYRAFIAKNALAANDPEEAFNFVARQDARDEKLDGSRRYVLRFAPGQTPPVHAFWSLTMYEMPKGFFFANPLDRYALGDRTKSLKRAADGSLEIYVQHDSPGTEKESNWLPAPAGGFELALRCYMADAAIPSGRWRPPAVTPVE